MEKEQICDPLTLSAIVRTKSEQNLHTGYEFDDEVCSLGSSYDSDHTYRFRIVREGQHIDKFYLKLSKLVDKASRRIKM